MGRGADGKKPETSKLQYILLIGYKACVGPVEVVVLDVNSQEKYLLRYKLQHVVPSHCYRIPTQYQVEYQLQHVH
jgi:hypothetical protein